jgi:hypothetical protein
MKPDLAYYVVTHYPMLLTDIESRANRHLIGTLKATKGRDSMEAQEETKQHKVFSRLLSNDPQVLELTRDGLRAFRARTATRILEEHGDKIFLNRCPRCQELARTPTAKQCRFCGLDWHSTNQNA